ncbi:MAG TPA: hypothetical protein VFA21_13335 [Pyrinomonadaceae bacterium]|nr:hypothetical protein [Pyrinomonadaceae bacterium]
MNISLLPSPAADKTEAKYLTAAPPALRPNEAAGGVIFSFA